MLDLYQNSVVIVSLNILGTLQVATGCLWFFMLKCREKNIWFHHSVFHYDTSWIYNFIP